MNIVFWADCFTEHQRHLSVEINKRVDSFIFVADNQSGRIDELIGKKPEFEPEFVLHINSSMNKDISKQLIREADVIIAGKVPSFVIRESKRQKKLVLRYSERPLKQEEKKIEHILRAAKWKLKPKHSNMYLLAAGAFATYDYNKYGLYNGKSYKWGYFPELYEYEIEQVIKEKRKNSIMWAGRLIDWKQPEVCLELAKHLKEANHDFSITIAGDGPLKSKMEDACREQNLSDYVSFTGEILPRQVRKLMEESAIYICSSNRKEGWGAVVNEAMNSGCAVIANHMIGSVPFLISNTDNGYTYQSVDELKNIIDYLLNNEEECRRVGTNAYRTIADEWNAVTAAKRLIQLSGNLLDGNGTPFGEGPCSVAEAICGEWKL